MKYEKKLNGFHSIILKRETNMSVPKIILSSAGLRNVIHNTGLGENEFEFIFGDQDFKTTNFFAEFISPAVSRLHQADPTINSIHFGHLFSKSATKSINQFITKDTIIFLERLSSGFSIEINEEQSFKLQLISIILENEELFDKLNSAYSFNINKSNIDRYLQNLLFFNSYIKTNKYFNYSKIIDFIAGHFHSIDENKLMNLPKTILYSIISNHHFKIENEDSLLDFINKIYNNNDKNDEDEEISITEFYEKVEFLGLSENKFREFIKEFDINEMTITLWRKLCQCFHYNVHSREKRKKDRYLPPLFEYDGKTNHSFNGIIHHLTEEAGGNVDEKGIVKVTSSSTNGNNLSKYAVDLDDNQHYFQSHHQPDSWLKYDFKKRKIRPTHYSIRTRHDWGNCSCHPKNWVIEGSNTNNGVDWKILDTRSEVTCLDDKNAVHTFEIQPPLPKNECYRFLRIRQTGFNTGDNFYFTLSALEFFGSIH